MSHQASQFISEWLQDLGQKQPDGSIAKAFYSVISQAGFSGSSHYVTTKDGIFFPQKSLIQTPVASDTGAPAPPSVQTDNDNLGINPDSICFWLSCIGCCASIEGHYAFPVCSQARFGRIVIKQPQYVWHENDSFVFATWKTF
jgi:hypothetical protein